MEIEGHPTQDLVEELGRRGAIEVIGETSGPDPEGLTFLRTKLGEVRGRWLFVPSQAYDTGFDERP